MIISYVCYYGRNNAYTSHCVKTYPNEVAGIGLPVGYRVYPPDGPENPSRMGRAIKEDGLGGRWVSPIDDRDVVWMNDSAGSSAKRR